MKPKPLFSQVHQMLDGTARVFLAEALLLPTGLVTASVLTRQLGPAGYGMLTLSGTVVGWIEATVAAILARTTVKFVAETHDWLPIGTTAVRLSAVLGGGAALLLCLLAGPIAALLNEPELAGYLRLFALDIPIFVLARAHQNILVGIGAFRQRALASAGRYLTRMLLIILLVELGLSVSGAILGSIGASVVQLLVTRFYVRPSPFRRSAFPAHRLWGYAGPLFLTALVMRTFDKLDLLTLKTLGGTAAQSGIYGAAQNLSMVAGIFAFSFSPLLLSTLSRSLRAGATQDAAQIGRNAMRLVILLLPFAGLMAGAAPEVVTLIYGSEFAPGAPILAVLGFGSLAMMMISVATAILTAAGKPHWTIALVGPMLPLAVIGFLLLIPRLGGIGASLVTTLVATLGALVTVLAVHRIWHVLPPAHTVVRSVLVCALAFGLAALWSTPGFLLLLKLLATTLLIGFAYLLLGEFSKDELALARSLVPWPIRREQHSGEA